MVNYVLIEQTAKKTMLALGLDEKTAVAVAAAIKAALADYEQQSRASRH